MDAPKSDVESDSGTEVKSQVIYRCEKCRRIVALQEHIQPHEPGGDQQCFKWKKRSGEVDSKPAECSSIFVKSMKWMESVQQYGCVGDKIQCMGCKARLGPLTGQGCSATVGIGSILHFNCTRVVWMSVHSDRTLF